MLTIIVYLFIGLQMGIVMNAEFIKWASELEDKGNRRINMAAGFLSIFLHIIVWPAFLYSRLITKTKD